jgi:hypothetical protein
MLPALAIPNSGQLLLIVKWHPTRPDHPEYTNWKKHFRLHQPKPSMAGDQG